MAAYRILEADGSFRVAVTPVAPPEGMLIVVSVEAPLERQDDELVACPFCGDPTPLLWSPRRQHPEWVCSTCGASGAVRVSGPPPRNPNLYEIADS